jgi:hypothetical protein
LAGDPGSAPLTWVRSDLNLTDPAVLNAALRVIELLLEEELRLPSSDDDVPVRTPRFTTARHR